MGNKTSTMGNTNNHRGAHVQVPWVTLDTTVGNMHSYRGLHNSSTVGDTSSTVGYTLDYRGLHIKYRGWYVQVPWVTLISTGTGYIDTENHGMFYYVYGPIYLYIKFLHTWD